MNTRHLVDKYIISHWDPAVKTRKELDAEKKIIVNVNNYCNLDCFSCVSLCHLPYGNPWRDNPRNINPQDVDIALTHILNTREYHYATLAGGEPTASLSQLEEINNVIHSHKLKTQLLTNGYKVPELNPHNYDYIVIDHHGTNKQDVENAVKHLKNHSYTNYYIHQAREHHDFGEALTRPHTSPGPYACPGWMQHTLWLDVIYPCCGMPQMEGWLNTTAIRDSLRREGWTTENPELTHTLRQWRHTIPAEIVKFCLFNCWKYREPYVTKNIVAKKKARLNAIDEAKLRTEKE